MVLRVTTRLPPKRAFETKLTNGPVSSKNGKLFLDVSVKNNADKPVDLTLQTLSAHAFNFYAEDLDQGVYEVRVHANAMCSDNEDSVVCDPSAGYDARAWIGLGSIVVDEARFTR